MSNYAIFWSGQIPSLLFCFSSSKPPGMTVALGNHQARAVLSTGSHHLSQDKQSLAQANLAPRGSLELDW